MNIKSYNQFNEEISKDRIKTLALAGIITAGSYGIYNNYINQGNGIFVKEVTMNDIKFKKYDVYSNNNNFSTYISNDGVISTYHTYSKGSGDSERTIHRYIINLPNNTTEFYYDKKFFNIPMASLKEFDKSKKIEIKDLKVKEKTNEYTIYYGGFLSTLDYIIVNHAPILNGEEFKLDDNIGIYYNYKINDDIYIIGTKGLGGGKFGGGGASSKW